MDKQQFAKQLKWLLATVIAIFTAQGMLSVLVHSEKIQLRSVVLLLHQSYTAVVTDNIRWAASQVGLSVSRAAADYAFIFLAFTIPLVTSAFTLHPRREDWQVLHRGFVWFSSSLLAAMLLLVSFFAAQNVFFSVMSPDFDKMIGSQFLFGLPIRFITIGSTALVAFSQLWLYRDAGPEVIRQERRVVMLRTSAVVAIAAALILINHFVAF